nr:hypothetical protein [Acidobacteriota bacterium]
ATVFALDSDKKKTGRNASPTRPQPTTWDQKDFGNKPVAGKVEDTQIFSPNFYLTGMFSVVNGGFELAPEGGLGPTPYLDPGFIWHNSFLLIQTPRPQKQAKLDASTFFNTGGLSHELKYGAGYREAQVSSLSRWAGFGIVYDTSIFGLASPDNLLAESRASTPSDKLKYKNVYAQDTLTVGNLTANVGLRYDVQEGKNLAANVPANALNPVDLPAVSYPGSDIGFKWKSFQPRLGLTYALGKERKTLLRASYSQFADQLGTGVAGILNPLGTQSYAYRYTTNPGNGNVTPGQVVGGPVLFYSGNVNPNNGLLLQSNGVAHNLKAPKTDELLLSVEHALLPEFSVGINGTYRKYTDILQNDLLVFDSTDPYNSAALNSIGRLATRADYTPVTSNVTLQNGQKVPITYYVLNSNLSTRNGLFEHNTGKEQTFKGASLVFNKRLSNRWMMRGNVSYNDWYWSKVPAGSIPNPTQFLGGGAREGDAVLQGSGTASGPKGGVYINSKYSYSLNALYQVAPDRPWGFNMAGNLTGRQGYPAPYFTRFTLPANEQNATVNVQSTSRPDSIRLDNINIVDLRLEKEFTFSDVGLTLGADCFNVFNEAFIQQRQLRLQRSTTNNVLEITSPRIFRFGARFSFK